MPRREWELFPPTATPYCKGTSGFLQYGNHVWIVTADVPAFVKFEGPLYMNGPAWRIELTSPRWPDISGFCPGAPAC